MEIIGLLATIITIVTGVWFFFDKFRNVKSKEPDVLLIALRSKELHFSKPMKNYF